MTGFAALPLAEHGGGGGGSSAHSPHLVGVAKVLGPRWLQLPALTLGLLGVQVFWSIEMSYGACPLLSPSPSRPPTRTVSNATQPRRTSSPSASPRPPSPSPSSPARSPGSSSSPSSVRASPRPTHRHRELYTPPAGVLADNSKSRFGRRRPYMLAGTCVCVTSMLLLGFTRPFATLFTPAGSIAVRVPSRLSC